MGFSNECAKCLTCKTSCKKRVEDELLGLSVLAADAGKGVAEEELLIDLEFIPAEPKVTEELLIDLEMDVAELERTKFQPRIQNLEKVGDLEILGEELLIDMNHVQR